MANLVIAVDYMLRWEDSTLSGVVTVGPGGMRTRFGIDENYHPELRASLFFSTMGNQPALGIAKGIYFHEYCIPLCLAEITNQDVANKLLSLGVNMGVERAAKMLQTVLEVKGDGRIGPLTLNALDRADPAEVLSRLRLLAAEYYEQLAAKYPADREFINGWLRRANA